MTPARKPYRRQTTTGLALRLYLALFMATGCVPRPQPVSVAEARYMETRIEAYGYDRVFKASISALQDLRFTIDMLDRDIGLIVASRLSEGAQARLVEEPPEVRVVPVWQKVLGVTLILAIITGIFWLFSRGGSAADADADHADDRTVIYTGGNASRGGPAVHEYRLTLNIEAQGDAQTRIRTSATGRTVRGGVIVQAGAIEDPAFFQRFYDALQTALRLSP